MPSHLRCSDVALLEVPSNHSLRGSVMPFSSRSCLCTLLEVPTCNFLCTEDRSGVGRVSSKKEETQVNQKKGECETITIPNGTRVFLTYQSQYRTNSKGKVDRNTGLDPSFIPRLPDQNVTQGERWSQKGIKTPL